jgi:transcriptional regulator with XRE-family HTH domain
MTKQSWILTGLRLLKARTEAGLSQADVREALGLTSIGRVSEWESGKIMPSGDHKDQLCALYMRMHDDLFYELRREAVQKIERYNEKVRARELKKKQDTPP